MPSTYSTSLKLELIGNGEQSGTWGTTTNNNLGTLLEQAITGVQPITLTGGDYTLTNYNGLSDEARNAVLVLGGSLASSCNVIAPSVNKTYIVRNFSGATVTIKTASGNGVALTNAASAVVFCDGTDFYSATTLNYIDGNLVVTGTTTLQGAVTANSTVTIKGDVFANSNTGQIYIPSGTTGQRTGSPISGVFRYNTTLNVYEGYSNGTWVAFQTYPQGNYTANYMVAAGGGGGGQNSNPAVGSAGGGAGGYIASSVTFNPGTTYYAVIGAGGTSGGISGTGGSGGNSALTGIATAIGGGGGSGGGVGVSGGSGGGSSADCGVGGAGTAGQGNKGGDNYCRGGGNYGSTGGGGAGAQGNNSGGDYISGSAGGVGLSNTLLGSTTYFCGGGGGWGQANYGAGGTGGGGAGNGTNGSTNSGGGGGGYGGIGGSGVIIISVPTVNYTGTTTGAPTVTINGAYTVMKFTTSGTYVA